MDASRSVGVVACCCVSVHEKDIFGLWLLHYAKHVDAIAVEKDEDCSELENLCRRPGVQYTIDRQEHFSPEHATTVLRDLVSTIESSWVLHVDSDEFLHEISELREVVALMEAEGVDFAFGSVVDRLAFGGRLGTTEDITSYDLLEARFPVRASVTESLAKGLSDKPCMIQRSDWDLIGGTLRPHSQRAAKSLTLERFRWRAGLEERVKSRRRAHPTSDIPWVSEGERILAELNEFGRVRAEQWLVPKSQRIHGWMNYEDIYRRAVASIPENGQIVEVGVWQGRSLCFLAEVALAIGKRCQIYGVDPFRNFVAVDRGYPRELRETVRNHSWLHLAAANLHEQGVLDYVNLLQLRSLQAARIFERESLDFVWIDGAHDYETVRADIAAWWPLIKRGGILAGHDYNKSQVRRAVRDSDLHGGRVTPTGTSFQVSRE